MRPSGPRGGWFRSLFSLLVRGACRDDVLADLDELYRRDLERGVAAVPANVRFAQNALASAATLAWAGLTRGVRTVSMLDVRLGVRMLLKQPLLTGVAALALSLGIPASLAVYHGWTAMMAPMPFDEGDRVYGVRNWDRSGRGGPAWRGVLHDFEFWRGELSSFQSLAAYTRRNWNVRSAETPPAPASGAEISASAFEILRVAPVLGRPLLPADEVVDAQPVALISTAMWRSRFSSDPGIVGRSIQVGGVDHVVVGVMPEGFHFPYDEDLWLPFRSRALDYPIGEGPVIQVFGRLSEQSSLEQARAEVAVLGQRRAEAYPESHAFLTAEVVTMPILMMGFRAGAATELEVVSAYVMSILLLIIACANIGQMFLARTASRLGEIAVRTALGASRARVVTQLFVEALILALAATGAGLLLSAWFARQVDAIVGPQLPHWMSFALTWQTVVLAIGVATVSAVIAGVLPALRATSRGIQGNLQRSAGGGATIRFGLFSAALIVVEVALSVGFLSFGTAAVGAAFQDTEGELGLEPERYLVAQLRIQEASPMLNDQVARDREFAARVRQAQTDLRRELVALPGIAAVAMGGWVPGYDAVLVGLEVEGGGGTLTYHRARRARVDPDFFEHLGRPILVGRPFDSGDLPADPEGRSNAVIVNTTFVEQVFGGAEAVGRRFRDSSRGGEPGPWYEVVGVVGPLAMNLHNPAQDAGFYHPVAPGDVHPVRIIIEARGPTPLDLTPGVRAVADRIDPTAMIEHPRLVAAYAREASYMLRFGTLSLVGLTSVTLLLAVTGLYALMSFTVSLRTREIGIRSALGARPCNIIATIARRALAQLAVGVVLGLPVAIVMVRDAYEMIDPATAWPSLVGVVVGTVVVGLTACMVPTLRGLRVRPTKALRDG